MKTHTIQARVTGILVENNQILLVRQRVNEQREWSLPGGRLEANESLQQAVQREMREETGLQVSVKRLLYLADKQEDSLLHITFELQRTGGHLRLPTNEFDANPISDVRFVPIKTLETYGFSTHFKQLVQAGFPHAPAYIGHKRRLGL